MASNDVPDPSTPTSSAQEPQAVLAPLSASAIFLVVTIDPGGESVVRDLLVDLSSIERTVSFRDPDSALALVTGIGSDAWDRLFAGPRPAELHPFRELKGPRHHAVATPGDLLFHIRASRADMCFEVATLLMERLEGAATVADEVHGFKYFDDRDLLGFVDGSENPTGIARGAAALVGDEDPEFTGSSYVIVQRYLHDLKTWRTYSVEDQQNVIGRHKLSNVELPDDEKPSNSHVALNTIEDPDGTQRQILRANMAFGAPGTDELGTYFIGYCGTPDVTEQMLRNMFLGSPEGNTDRILEVSTPTTGTLFFVPTVDFLDDIPSAPGELAQSGEAPGGAAEGGDNLGIGSLVD